MNIAFDYPYILFLLFFLVCFIFCIKKSNSLYIPKLKWIGKTNRFLNLDLILKILIFSLFVISLSSVFKYDSIAPSDRYGKDIVLCLDASGSMKEGSLDKSKKSKFELLQDVLSDFIDMRVSDNLGIVVFGTFAFSPSPVTYDHNSLKEILYLIEPSIAGENTAIGEGIAQSIRTLKFGNAKKKIIILISDGFTNAGSVSVKEALLEVKKSGIKIYTIGLGQKKDYDATLLELIAKESGAKSFSVSNLQELKEVYEKIDILEKSPIRSQQYLNRDSLYIYPLSLSIVLLIWFLYRRGVI